MQALWYKVVLGSALCKLCSTKSYWNVLCASFVVQSTKRYWEVVCANFVVQSSTGNDFVQAL